VRLFLYDRDPRSHHLDVTKFENTGLYRHTPGNELPNLKQFDAVLVHVSDDKHFKQDVSTNAIKNGLLLVIFSGDAGITSDTETLLKAQYPMARICTISVRDLQSNIEAALTKQDLEELCWDRLLDVHEILSTLWALDLHWEKQGRPSVVTNSDGTFSLGIGERTLTDSNEMLSLAELAALRATNGRSLRTLSSRIYKRSPKPSTDFQVLAVSNHHEYHLGVAHLRDSLLAWAQSPE